MDIVIAALAVLLLGAVGYITAYGVGYVVGRYILGPAGG